MDDNKKDVSGLVDSWLDEIMKKMDLPEEEQSPQTADPSDPLPDLSATMPRIDGLSPVEDDELERIVQETLAEDWGSNSDQESAPSAEDTSVQSEAHAAETEITPTSDEEKTRPKNKSGYGLWGIPHIISTAIWLVLILAIGVSLGRTLWLSAADLLALGKTPQAVSITIDVKDRMPDIAKKLQDAGMIRYPWLFEQFAKLTGKGDNILVGKIDFNEEMVYDYNALVNAMSFRGGARVTLDVMIPEGYNCAQIFALLEEKGVCSARALEKYAAEGKLESYWFLDGVERGHKYCLEGNCQ